MKVESGSGRSLLPISGENRLWVLAVLTDDLRLRVLAVDCQWLTLNMFSVVLSYVNRPQTRPRS